MDINKFIEEYGDEVNGLANTLLEECDDKEYSVIMSAAGVALLHIFKECLKQDGDTVDHADQTMRQLMRLAFEARTGLDLGAISAQLEKEMAGKDVTIN